MMTTMMITMILISMTRNRICGSAWQLLSMFLRDRGSRARATALNDSV